MRVFLPFWVLFLLFSATVEATSQEVWDRPDWSLDATINPGENRSNIYELPENDYKTWVRRGKLHALVYPVDVSGLYVPYGPLKKFLKSSDKILAQLMEETGDKLAGLPIFPFKSRDHLYEWMGLASYPAVEGQGVFQVPFPEDKRPDYRMGVTIQDSENGERLTFSCAACHSMSLFGKRVIGLTNKRPRANETFVLANKYIPYVHPALFKLVTGANKGETREYARMRNNLRSVGLLSPLALGLDTSLAQVALSIAKRNDDAYLTKSPYYERNPRYNELQKSRADSKPAVWWNLKYKTRWLSDGSIVSGNPIFTNFLWNEIGRGVDLKLLEQWLKDNKQTVMELTSAVFSTSAPRWVDYFDPETISIEKAKKGERIFAKSCQKCHGAYNKGWSAPDADQLSRTDLLATTKVRYHKKTPVKNVGTDPNRFEGMKHFADDLNKLTISKWMKTVVEPQVGYVPPPLVGIWSRYPYLHNNSIPSLCALLTPAKKRPQVFYQGPADNIQTDFDSECVGYPIGNNIPESWKKEKDARIDTSREGLRNIGHEKMLLNADGSEKFSKEQKLQLIEFLKTL